MAFGSREGRGDRYFCCGKKNSLGAARNWRVSVVQAGTVDCRQRRGGVVRRRGGGEEAELPVSNSEGLNLESEEEQWKCGFW